MVSLIEVGDLTGIRPVINFANLTTFAAGMRWGPRIIPDCQIIHVVSGSAEVTVSGARRIIVSGDTVFYGKDTPHQILVSPDQPCTFYSFHFSWDQVSAVPVHPHNVLPSAEWMCSSDDLEKQGPVYSVTMDGYGQVIIPHFFSIPKIENLMAPIVHEYVMAEAGYSFMMRGQLYLLLMEIIRGLMSNRIVGSEQSKKIAVVLEAMQNEPNRSWTTKQLARIGGYHPTYFAAIFKEAVGHAPKHFLILERIRLAKTLLLELDTIEATADKLGYSSVHYFSRHFKEVTGFTPSEYKKRSTFL
ncbi:AraC family transcriptional regulator [Paenibacillus psychroresistens]|uniref:AraC family transcriptional regulator n=1 Tax=Paenibacillus psychroresistens TaxID=1778678 RepID=A0A6B8RIX5_9BACL|nr:AraC family transcriptional regulator [Paenibacillus psychroresistens]QGQ96009.1 AraC family transcriptional regulator [Paenibacillus psychroresistens]